ncbi:MAG: hypothetical protein WD042_05945 [Phycisphaeraceae bacterium]
MAALHTAGPQAAGLLRIQKGQQERHIWPVHLSGWLATGWHVAGAREPAPSNAIGAFEAGAGTAPARTSVDLEAPLESDAKSASTRGKRGRRTKEEPNQESPADDVSLPAPTSAEPEEAPITALPDGLFDDQLI